jgi:hypothetical protein
VNARMRNTARTTTRVSRRRVEPCRGIPLPLDTAHGNKGGMNPDHIANESTTRAIAAGKLKHNFAIKLLKKTGLFQPQPYLYFCVRCRFTFLVNQTRGSIVAVNPDGKPLSEPENSARIATFAEGPCPALEPLYREFSSGSRRRVSLARSIAHLLNLPRMITQR